MAASSVHIKSWEYIQTPWISSATGKRLGICETSKPFLNLFTFLGLFNSWGVTSSTCLPPAVWRSTSFGDYFKWLLSELKCSPFQILFPTSYRPQDVVSVWLPAPGLHISAAMGVAFEGLIGRITGGGSMEFFLGWKCCLGAGIKKKWNMAFLPIILRS